MTVIRSRASACPFAGEHRVGRGAQLRAVGDREPEPGGGVREPVEVTGPRERLPVVDPDGLEHAVADEQAVVERRDPRRVGVEQRAVDPDEGARRRPRRHDATRAADVGARDARSRLALSSVSRPLGVGLGVGDDAAAHAEVGAAVRRRRRAR